MTTTANLWERQPGEPDKAFAAFVAYRDAGRARSLDAVGRLVHGAQTGRKRGSTGRVRAWSSRWRWVERAQAYDLHLDRLARGAREEEVRRLQEKHKLQLRHLFNQAIKAGQNIDPDKMTIEEVFRLTERLIYLERLVHGQPVSVEQVRHEGPDGGVVRQAHVIAQAADPDPAYLAQVMQILSSSGALDSAVPEGGAAGLVRDQVDQPGHHGAGPANGTPDGSDGGPDP
jgi:hypothetical protein